jgi:ABC-type sugar transport system permease subunit
VAPAVSVILLIAVFPLVWAGWESLHAHDLRHAAQGHPFIGLANYAEALSHPRFWGAMGHTLFFTGVTVFLELVLGMALALALDRATRARGWLRTSALIPWALPTVVSAMLWRFLFDDRSGAIPAGLHILGLQPAGFAWLADPTAAWVPILLADVWKTTPFVGLLLLAGLQGIDRALYEAAWMDGAGPWRQFLHITLPQLRPAILVALLFRTMDAFRVFDLVYVLTGGGPGTATEPIALLTFHSLFQNLRFGYGSALSTLVFLVTLMLALLYLRFLRFELPGERS